MFVSAVVRTTCEMHEQDFDWDTVQMPLNPADHHYLSFEKQVLPVVAKRGRR